MHITFAPRGILQIDDCRIIYRNFSGLPSQYNREGDRNFAVIIPDQEMADALVADGWRVRVKPPRDEEDEPFIFMPVKVKFNNHGPMVYLETAGCVNRLDAESVGCLDDVGIRQVDLDIRPFDWVAGEGTPAEKRGRAAYLQSIRVVQEIDRFAAQYAEGEGPEE